ncbi:ABC transporter substrate-binding protein [Nocardia sp. IFM 10818]
MPVRESASTRNTFASPAAPARRLRTWGVVLAAAAVLPGLLAGCSGSDDDAMSSIVRTTTNIAGAGVVGLERDTAKACALPSSPDSSSGTRTINSAAGTAEVPADPKRIVVLSTAALDATCALGLWERVVGAATVSGPTPQPSYLGYGISEIPDVGSVGQPDPAKVAALKPDVILGTAADGAQYRAMREIAPTVLVGDDFGWQAEFTSFAEALGRKTAAATVLEDYRTVATDTGNAVAANLTQASVLRFERDDIQMQGLDSFAGQVLTDAGVQRPGPQRVVSYDVGADLSAQQTRDRIEGDIAYVMFDGPDGLEFGKKTMSGDDWKELSVSGDKRVFAVEDSIWHGSGVIAARALLDDIRKTLNGYVTD